MKKEKVKTHRCYLRKRRGVLCVDVVAECDRFVGEWWECGVCKGKEGGPGGCAWGWGERAKGRQLTGWICVEGKAYIQGM
jgi:hypothetical protein